jgi:phosphoglycolate phosphatase
MVEAIIFDFDGVLVNSFPDQHNWFKFIYKRLLGKEFPYSLEEFKEIYIEPAWPELYQLLGFDLEAHEKIIKEEYFHYKSKSETPLFEGMKEVVKELFRRGIRLAISSSNTRLAIEKQISDHNLENYFEFVVGYEDLILDGVAKAKPDPRCIIIALERLKKSPNEVIYVGDHPVDIIAARKVSDYKGASVPVLVTSYGFASRERLAKLIEEEFIIDRPEEILEKI